MTVTSLIAVVGVAVLLWYPGQYASLAGLGKQIAVLVAVNLIVGPGLSTFVYKHGKKRLMFDLGFLAVVEIVALVWAGHAIYSGRPVYVVFAVDRFEVVTVGEIDAGQFALTGLQDRPGHEPRLVFAELPADPEVRGQVMDDVLFKGLADIDRRPEFWHPYAAGLPAVLSRARPLQGLVTRNDPRAESVRRWLEHNGVDGQDYRYLPLRGRQRDAALVLHADIGFPVGIIDVDPW